MKFAFPLLVAASLLSAPAMAEDFGPEEIAQTGTCQAVFVVQSKLFAAAALNLMGSYGGQSNDESTTQTAESAAEASQVTGKQALMVAVYAKKNGLDQSYFETVASMTKALLGKAIAATFNMNNNMEASLKMIADIHAEATKCDAWFEKTVIPAIKQK